MVKVQNDIRFENIVTILTNIFMINTNKSILRRHRRGSSRNNK